MILTVTANAAIDKRYVVEKFGAGNVNRVKSCVATAGGKGLNVSRVAHLAGEKVTATGFLGGHAGAFIDEHVKSEGIQSEFVWCSGESRTCINIWDEVKKEQTEFLEPGFTLTDYEIGKMQKKFRKLLESCDLVTISGSIPKGADSRLYQDMIREAKDAGKKVLLDTSGKVLEECIQAQPTMIKPNIDEIRMMTGKPMNSRTALVQAAEDIHAEGIEVVVISLGADGSLVCCDEGVFSVKVPKINAVNTVGCGDSMIAGYAVGFVRNLPIKETIRLAAAISAANAMRMETGYFVRSDMEVLLPNIEIKKLYQP